jgi:hypothetical protein
LAQFHCVNLMTFLNRYGRSRGQVPWGGAGCLASSVSILKLGRSGFVAFEPLALDFEALPELDNLGVEGVAVAGVFEDVVGAGGFVGVGNLVAEADAGFSGSGSLGGGIGAYASGVAGYFGFVGGCDDDDAVDAVAPVGEDGFGFAAGAGVALDLKDQRRLDDGYGGGIASEDFGHPAALLGDDGGMDDGVEFLQAAALEGKIGEVEAVEAAVRGNDFRTEDTDDLGKDGLAGLHEGAAQLVGFDDLSAEFAEYGGYGAFAAA